MFHNGSRFSTVTGPDRQNSGIFQSRFKFLIGSLSLRLASPGQKPCLRLRQARRRLQAAARQDDGHPSPSKEIQNKKSREREELPHQHSTGFRERAGCGSKMATANQN